MKREFLDSIASTLDDSRLVAVSFREPYAHSYEGDEIVRRRNSGGVVTALDPVMRAVNGTWVAFGFDDADKDTVNERNECTIDSPEGSYTLKRVFIPKPMQDRYSSGACNSALWPLSHLVYVRPQFVDEEWEAYEQANKLMAQAVAECCKDGDIVWIHDYQLALAASYLKKLRPGVTTALSWHIPWPGPTVFRIYPWANEFLEGMLAHDIVGFQTSYHATNFLDTVDSSLEAKVDRAGFGVQYGGKHTEVTSGPISVDYEGIRRQVAAVPQERVSKLLKEHGLKRLSFAVGVDRMDYTKGIQEKFLAVDMLLKKHPKHAGKFTLLQIASPTRLHIGAYQAAAEQVEETAEQVNWTHSSGKWKPIIFLNKFADYEDILALYSASSMCVVSSLHDGMNLVCKEYVAASDDGVLVLSKFAGASLELNGALLVNPYSLSSLADAMHAGLQMDKAERQARLERMHREVSNNDVFHWAAKFIGKIDVTKRRKS